MGDDLIEGKLSLPILHCLLTSQEDTPVHALLYGLKTSKERKENPSLIHDAITFMTEKSKSVEFTRSLIKEYASKAISFIELDPRAEDPKESFLVKAAINLSNV